MQELGLQEHKRKTYTPILTTKTLLLEKHIAISTLILGPLLCYKPLSLVSKHPVPRTTIVAQSQNEWWFSARRAFRRY